MKSFPAAILVSISFSVVGFAQSPAPAAPPQAPSNQITPQILAEMLRSATTFHDLVQGLNKSLGAEVHKTSPDGIPQHSMERTATTIGAGAGVGAALGGMSKNPNGVVIGAMIGGAGGLILDQILKHYEEAHPKPADTPAAAPEPGLITR
jgi:hypothetical protein